MKLPIFSSLFLMLCLTGCLVNKFGSDVSRQINVFGIELYSGTDYREFGGVKASEESCLRGYERSFDPLEITIGYGFDKKIRRITTRNPGTSMFGISPGMPVADGVRLAQQAGFTKVSPHLYQGKDVSLTLLVDSTSTIFGITVESRD